MTNAMPRPGYQAIIWDFDGTLTRRPDMWCTSIAEACQLAGALDVTPADFDNTAYLYLPWNTKQLCHPHAESAELWWHAFLTHVRPLVAERVNRTVVDMEAVLHAVRKLALDPQRYEVLTESTIAVTRISASGLPQYVLSNHVPELDEIVSDLFPYRFREVWSSGRIGFEKPREEIFRYALDRIPFPADTVLMVGDDYYRDLEPARTLGMQVMHVSEVCSLR